jgi:hypothetical protein
MIESSCLSELWLDARRFLVKTTAILEPASNGCNSHVNLNEQVCDGLNLSFNVGLHNEHRHTTDIPGKSDGEDNLGVQQGLVEG